MPQVHVFSQDLWCKLKVKVVISFQEEDSKDALTDGDPDTFWETDGRQGKHWIKLSMRAGTIIRLVY